MEASTYATSKVSLAIKRAIAAKQVADCAKAAADVAVEHAKTADTVETKYTWHPSFKGNGIILANFVFVFFYINYFFIFFKFNI